MESEKPATTLWGRLLNRSSLHPQPHHSSGDIIEEGSPIVLTDYLQQKSTSLNNKLRELPTDQPPPIIYKVNNRLRNVNNDAYEPTLVAIGPYHRKKDKLQMMEKKKLQFLQQFLKRSQGNLAVEVFFSTIQSLKPEADRWYDEPIDLDPAEFVEMLLLDGCFIIEFVLQSISEPNGMPIWMEAHITQDLILFENQIPYCVISELFSLISKQDFGGFVLGVFRRYYPIKNHKGNTGSSKDDIKHLLELIHKNLIPMPQVSESTKDLDLAEKGQQKDEVSCCNRYCCFSVNWLGCIWCNKRQDHSDELDLISSATRLSKYNVKFRKGEPNDSMFQISFEKGTLRVPCVKIQDTTESFFRNLIVYEQYFPSEKNHCVVDYVKVFDCLITDGEDVKLLVKCGIIDNLLGSEDVVAHMFNKLGDHVIMSRTNFTYKGEFKKIKDHCKKRRHAWMAKLKQDYFNSPWTVISVTAAFVLLVLTFLQTLFTIK